MIEFQLSQAAEVLGGKVLGKDVSFVSVGTDTRTLKPGDLFVAISGPNFDGHDYLAVARQQGAAAAIVSRETDTSLPCILVDDTLQSLGQLAAAWRDRARARVAGITGSNGKTTLKEMTAAILGRAYSVLATRGNLNNDIGMPLTLMRLQDQECAVIEMGANHAGEIAYLSGIARPDVVVLNNAGRAHLEGFGSLEGVARAKAEIIQGLKAGGTFVYNADDRFAPLWQSLSEGLNTQTFGVAQAADVRSPADSYRIVWGDDGFQAEFDVQQGAEHFSIKLQLAGEHNRMNALAAIATVRALTDVSLEDIQQGLAELQPVPGRLCPMRAGCGARVVDDSYNANPDSVAAAIAVLQAAPGIRVLVLGDLGELGEEQLALHAEVGRVAAESGIEKLFTCGQLSKAASYQFGAAARHFEEQQDLMDFLTEQLTAEHSVLIKGSRSAAMERVVRALCAGDNAC